MADMFYLKTSEKEPRTFHGLFHSSEDLLKEIKLRFPELIGTTVAFGIGTMSGNAESVDHWQKQLLL